MEKTQSPPKESIATETTSTTTTTTTQLPGLKGVEIIKSSPRYTKENSQYSTIKK